VLTAPGLDERQRTLDRGGNRTVIGPAELGQGIEDDLPH
jgi:hypothetical protein